jgi:probable biosynthetic protein (TIGR04098 family)
MDHYDLVLGLPHTNYQGFAEHLLMMQAGHCQWTSIARAIGTPLSSLRTAGGQEVYATFYFIEEVFPDDAPLISFRLDHRVSFAVFLRAFKGIAIEGKIVFDQHDRLRDWLASAPEVPSEEIIARHPYIRFANIFITPEAGNSKLKVAAPVGAGFSSMPPLPIDENPYPLCKEARETGSLGLLDEWSSLDVAPDYEWVYAIDRERDTNGAGLVYFANYISYMNSAEREALGANSKRPFSDEEIGGRTLRRRRVAYYGNVSTTDRIRTRVRLFQGPDQRTIGSRLEIRREEDDQLICLSEAIKLVPVAPDPRSPTPDPRPPIPDPRP